MKMWEPEGGRDLTAISGIATDVSDNVYVADAGSGGILKFTSGGSQTTWWDLRDPESGHAGIPGRIATDASNNLFITDRENNTFQRLTYRGNAVWGSEGTGDGQFSHPTGIAVDSSGNVYVADTGNDRIQKFHSAGSYLMQWGSRGNTAGVFSAPEGIAVDAYGHIYVADTGNRRIQKFSPDGTFLAQWGSGGAADGQFFHPVAVATDSWSNIYVADLTPRIQKFNPAGEYLGACNTSGNVSDLAIGPSGTMYVLWQSGSGGKIGKYRIPSSLPPVTPEKTHTIAITVRQTRAVTATPAAPATLQNATPPVHPPENQTPGVTTAPAGSPAPGTAPAMENDEQAGKTDPLRESLDRISAFFRNVFGVEIPVPA